MSAIELNVTMRVPLAIFTTPTGGHSYPRTHRGKERFPGFTITYALMEKLEEIQESTNGEMARIVTKVSQ